MIPIRIFGIRVPPDGHFEYALYDDTAHYDNRNPNTCFPSIEDLAAHVAHMMFSSAEHHDTALLCAAIPEHLSDLLAVRAYKEDPKARGAERRQLTSDEQVEFLECLLAELRTLKSAGE